MNQTKIQKWGHSMALRIPATTIRSWGVGEGQAVSLEIENGALVARPAQKRYTLDELLSQCDFTQPISAEEREWIDAPSAGIEEI
ncbi:AbrB/MazE/SpoVT family DNA-binding domain-containing protein [Acidithiobacillus thiooxidans]|uniref:AbrB family transcriptional regulator n=2 Tax=Acidithiobacillus thiooxidans TaxID=930 RepID=A0A1C2IIM4_ACITH|nr:MULTISPECIES: AbrB/MazE/SpoVT family DNA-binding domain-containing protein [Acidithiobacillus]MBE7566363.1 AbrB/MazE/SpoVT family DNA-binding domain-containing protein [Acidithiobacillus sp. HP-11]MBU2740758.1 AbrB/MazE/SpoVT family DNA-binding domain-containing protein [Acidithiobacillus albertensis]MBU2750416.1 AbrB/MazE/SpoVT family DNA-binding domain-containing protein [Acidithiobacillus thiooxidans]MBU2794202.1 AbrB/MazE/SpoVT family DNA-binding domain-containing protein [Acidithiobacil